VTLAVPFKVTQCHIAEDSQLSSPSLPSVRIKISLPHARGYGGYMFSTCDDSCNISFHVAALLVLFCHMWWSLPHFTEKLQDLLVSHSGDLMHRAYRLTRKMEAVSVCPSPYSVCETSSHRTGWSKCNILDTYSGGAALEFRRGHHTSWIYSGFTLFLWENSSILPWLGHDHFLPNPSEFIAYLSP
jgi:hypothetical protein